MRVLLSTYDSRGGVEPLVGLAVQLRALGAEVRICAPPMEIEELVFWSCWRSNLGSPNETTPGMTAATTKALRP